MAFKTENKIDGDNQVYSINPAIKRYTLSDTGFSKTNAGNFAFEQSLDTEDPYNGIKLKITFKSDLKSFKMSTVSGNGLNKVNIFKNINKDKLVEQFHYLMNNFIDREVFIQN
ncbi:cysteine desulfurase [Apilactobacillus timberlakei]|uniref:cysteine desulfurase n=1 Tax=Apilactobacillus timberlakei TaxID=2008380 RepID=UPI00112A194F|nr:cysteine desulfurase [Apilactobacillus timberlakei]TPR23874.1 cysteine desulfurase [Apilactobacillus timberlakei]